MSDCNVGISHFGFCVTDMERSLRFYTEALQFEVSHSVKAGKPFDILAELPGMDLDATFLLRDGLKIEMMVYVEPKAVGSRERRPMNKIGLTHMALTVDSLDAIAERIVKYGGQIFPATRVDTPDKGSLMFGADPDGIRLELWQKLKV